VDEEDDQVSQVVCALNNKEKTLMKFPPGVVVCLGGQGGKPSANGFTSAEHIDIGGVLEK
jgi:hypothetical protein